jgi:hypothetical protein
MKSDSVAETKWSVALTSGAMDSLVQALQDANRKTVCSFESKGRGNLHQLANASSVPTSEGCASPCHGVANGPSCTRPDNSNPLPLHPPTVEAYIAPGPFDVLFGTGKALREHAGNVRANHLVAMYTPEYDKADKNEKTDIAWHIVKIIQGSSGRFMKSDENEEWVEVEPGMAREKISHIFRNQRNQTRKNHRIALKRAIEQCNSFAMCS